jgi:hypothetical protein
VSQAGVTVATMGHSGETMAAITITDIAQGSEHREILEGLRDGTLRRYGGVIRHAAGRPEGGRIYAHLKDMGNDPFAELAPLVASPAGNPPMDIGQLLNLQSLTAVTSMVNLGVSVAGFAYTAYQLHGIRNGISTLQRLTQRGFAHVDARFDDVTRRLEEIVILQRADLLLTSEIQAAVEDVRSLLQTSMEAHLTASLESLRDLSAPDLGAHLTTIKEVRATCEAYMRDLTPRLDGSHQPIASAGWAHRLWAGAAAAEVDVLRSMNLAEAACSAADRAVEFSVSIAVDWIGNALDDEWIVFGHPRAAEHGVTPDRALRIAETMTGRELWRGELDEAYARSTSIPAATLGGDRYWPARNAVGAVADGLIESGRRIGSRGQVELEVAADG